MGLVNSLELLKNAKQNKTAVGAFNFTSLEQLKAIILASKELNIGCILSTSESAIKFLGIDNIVDIVKNETKNEKIKFSLHLDHGKSFEICKKCIDAGYNSVMIDASSLNFYENVNLTKQVVDYAHNFNVSVEGELGKIEGVEDNTKSLENILTNAEDALNFINLTGVDSLAISIGTSHGAYKFKGESKLDINRLSEIDKITNGFPLVLHGASSVNEKLLSQFSLVGGKLLNAKGVSDLSIKNAIKHGICKINVDTDLRIAFTTGVRQSLLEDKVYSPRDYLSLGIETMKKEVIERLKLFNNI